MEHTKISTDIEQNIKQFQQLFADSADIKMKEMRLGKGKRRRCFLAYIEVAVSNMLLETTALGRLLAALSELPDRDLNQVLNENAMGISDVTGYLPVYFSFFSYAVLYFEGDTPNCLLNT